MLTEIKQDARTRMAKSLEALRHELAKIRTGRAHPSLLEHIHVDYYGSQVPISQAANVTVDDARTLAVTAWDKNMVQVIEKAMSIDPAERYQNGDDFKKALLGSKSKTQKLTGDYVVAPPPPGSEGEPPAEGADPRGAKAIPSGPRPAPPA